VRNEVCRSLYSRYHIYLIILRSTSWYSEDQKGRIHNIDKNDFSLIVDDSRIRFDAVFIAIHGKPGEKWTFAGDTFDMLSIPYTSCDAFCSALPSINRHANSF